MCPHDVQNFSKGKSGEMEIKTLLKYDNLTTENGY